MKKNKHLKHILLGISLWFSAWTVTQGIFMSEILFKLPIDVNISYLITTILILVITIISLYIYPRHRKEALPKSKLLWLYTIPAVLLIALPSHYNMMLNIMVYIPMIIISVFWQDYLTFGMLQTFLNERVSQNKSAIIVAVVFLSGHLIFYLNDPTNPQFILIALAGFVFAFSRRYTKSIYIANIIHTIVYLI